MLAFVIGLLAALLWKVRKIHLATYQLLYNTSNSLRESEVLFTQFQALLSLEKKLGLTEPLPQMRGWAGSLDFLLATAEQILSRKPLTVMECSSGVSTIVVARCLQLNNVGHVYSLEHAPEFADKTRRILEKYRLTQWATVLDAPLQTINTDTPWYDEDVMPEDLGLIDMLIVDGPPMSTSSLSRYPALPRLMPRMANQFLILVDDANREDEIEMIKRWRIPFPHLQQSDGYCEKGLALLEAKDDANFIDSNNSH